MAALAVSVGSIEVAFASAGLGDRVIVAFFMAFYAFTSYDEHVVDTDTLTLGID